MSENLRVSVGQLHEAVVHFRMSSKPCKGPNQLNVGGYLTAIKQDTLTNSTPVESKHMSDFYNFRTAERCA